MAYQSNIGDVIAELEELTPTRNVEVEVSNSADYARPLHELEGYYVFNSEHFGRTVYQHLQDARSLSDSDILDALDAAGKAEVEWLRATPPPGGWTPRTGNLQRQYDSSAQHTS